MHSSASIKDMKGETIPPRWNNCRVSLVYLRPPEVCRCWFTCRVILRRNLLKSSAAVTMQAPGGHRGHSLQPVTAVPGCEGFPARALSLIFLSRLSQWGWGGGGEGEEDCFFLCWKWSSDFCDDVFSAMEQNPDGGAIMIVWCSVGGENGACREWATALEPAICQGGPPPMTRTPGYSHSCFSPLTSLAVALWEYRDFYGWMCCGRFSAVVVLEHKQTLSRLHRECCVYPPVCLSLFARQVVKSVYFWSRCPSCM